MKKIGIIDYGMGNLHSVQNALNYLNQKNIITSDLDEIKKCDKLILPGVGSFYQARKNLSKMKLDTVITELVSKKKIDILGICLGMQLLCESSDEDGFSEGLNLVPLKFTLFKDSKLPKPHIGFNEVKFDPASKLFDGLKKNTNFYFVHSYKGLPTKIINKISYSFYSEKFVSSFEYNNIYGTQFHPEKSQSNGLTLLKNFINI